MRWKLITIFVPYRGICFLYPKQQNTRKGGKRFSSPIGESTFSTKLEFWTSGGKKFSSPIGESTFSTEIGIQLYDQYLKFSSPIGESTFSTGSQMQITPRRWKFSSPIGESTFSTRQPEIVTHYATSNFRPLSGNLLSLLEKKIGLFDAYTVFVPYRGIYFLYNFRNNYKKRRKVFVPYRGIYFLYVSAMDYILDLRKFSSPIGESTFSTAFQKMYGTCRSIVFVPYRGIYFLYPCL